MNHFVKFGAAILMAVVGIALVGEDSKVFAGRGCGGCGGRPRLFGNKKGGDCCAPAPAPACEPACAPACEPAPTCGGKKRTGLLARRKAKKCKGAAETCCPAPEPKCCEAPAPTCCPAPAPAPTCCATAAPACDSCGGSSAPVMMDHSPAAPAMPAAPTPAAPAPAAA